ACRRCGNSARALGASTPILARRRRIVIVGVDEGDGASPPRLLAMAAGCGNRLSSARHLFDIADDATKFSGTLATRQRREGMLIEMHLHVAEVPVHRILGARSIARDDRADDVLMARRMDRLPFVAAAVLSEMLPRGIPLAAAEQIEQGEKKPVARRLVDGAVKICI